MRKLAIVVVAAVLVATFFWQRSRTSAQATTYRLVTLERTDLESTVSATGNLEAVRTVEVGTQVSGIISEIRADFNDHVEAGQVIAVLDTTLLAIAVREAQANLDRSLAEQTRAQREFERIRALFDKGLSNEPDFNQAEYAKRAADATVSSSRLSLERAKQNLTYATIYAPISGTVLERDVDVGQTVAASLSAPRLFVLAGDLSRLQILASVDESDIGRIRPGQNARFSVQAFAGETFEGTVRQVRLQSTTLENVVSYTVVIDVANEDGRLLPGMTATVDFVIETAEDVLAVSNAALRFRPTDEMLAALRAKRAADSTSADSSSRGGAGRENRASARSGSSRSTLLWVLDGGEPRAVRVRTGVTDGQSTEVEGEGLEAGMEIIASVTSSAQAASTNPFSGSSQNQGRPRPGAF